MNKIDELAIGRLQQVVIKAQRQTFSNRFKDCITLNNSDIPKFKKKLLIPNCLLLPMYAGR